MRPSSLFLLQGANLIPVAAVRAGAAAAPAAWRRLGAAAAAAHMNMLRVWGGGAYPPDALYDAADEAGILLWQEAMFACSPYPRGEKFLANVAEELRQQVGLGWFGLVRLVRFMGLLRPGCFLEAGLGWRERVATVTNIALPLEKTPINKQLLRVAWRPSVAVVGGNNEVEASFQWYPETRSGGGGSGGSGGVAPLYAVDYDRLFVALAGGLARKVRVWCVCVEGQGAGAVRRDEAATRRRRRQIARLSPSSSNSTHNLPPLNKHKKRPLHPRNTARARGPLCRRLALVRPPRAARRQALGRRSGRALWGCPLLQL